jgi:hypothetical protein
VAISLKTAGTWARIVADPSSVTIPGSPAAGDRMFLFVTWKDFAITVANPSGWTPIGSEFADGSVSAGNGTGSCKVMAWYRDWQSGDGNPSVDWSAAPTEGHAVIMLWQKGASDVWGTPVSEQAPMTNWTTTSQTVTNGNTTVIPSNSVVMGLIGIRDDSTTMTRPTDAIAVSEGTVTWNGNYVESPATHFNSTTGLDMSGDLGHRLVTTGATATLQLKGTISAAETGAVKWVVQGLAVFTGAGAASIAPLTASGSGEFDAPVYSATGAPSIAHLTASAAGTFAESGGTFTAAGAASIAHLAAAASGEFDAPVYTATAAPVIGHLTVSAAGEFDAPVYLASAAASVAHLVATASGTFTSPTYTAVGAATLPHLTATAAAEFDVPVYLASAAASLARLVAAASGTVTNPTYTGSGAATIAHLTAAATGIFASAVYTATGVVSLSRLTANGAALFSPPSYVGAGAVSIGRLVAAATGTFVVSGGLSKFPGSGAFTRSGMTGVLHRGGLKGVLARAGMTGTFSRKV